MNRISIILFSVLIISSGFLVSSCKKGENDPLLSLRTRNNRLKGNWELVKLEENRERYTEGYQLGTPYTYENSSTRTIKNGVENYASTTLYLLEGEEPNPIDCTRVRNIHLERDFQKNGIFTQFSVIEEDTSVAYVEWYWLDQEKKKTGIVIDGVLFQVDRLAKDELILKRNVETTIDIEEMPEYESRSGYAKYSYTAHYKK